MPEFIISEDIGDFLTKVITLGGSKSTKDLLAHRPYLANVHVSGAYMDMMNESAMYTIRRTDGPDAVIESIPDGMYAIEKISGA